MTPLAIVRPLIPRPVKRAARALFNAWADDSPLSGRVRQLADEAGDGRTERTDLRAVQDRLADQVRQLQQAVEVLQAWVCELQPDVLQPTDDGRRALADALARHGVDAAGLNTAVSKNDLMFQYLAREFVLRRRTIDWAFQKYFFGGLHMLQVVEAVVRRKFGRFDRVGSVLDFASGYGRLTRHLVRALDPRSVCVSDIKARAVEFQRAQLGVRGFVSTAVPEELAVGERFDCIIVASLFSHLPEALFGRWLQRLCDLLSPAGLLLFTVHDVSLSGETGRDVVFKPVSEEILVRGADRPLDTAEYGAMHVSEAYVRGVIERLAFPNRRYARYPAAMWNHQDVYVLSRDPADDLSGLTLPKPLI